MLKSVRYIALALAFGSTIAAPASAQDEDAVYAAYGAYQTALQSGDAATAASKAEEAWRLAEATWGDHENTAVLAYNYASYLFNSGRRVEAGNPARRSVKLSSAGFGADQIPIADAELISEVANLKSDDGKQKKEARKKLESMLKARTNDLSSIATIANLEMGRDCFFNAQYELAGEYGRAAQRGLQASTPNATSLIAESMMLSAVGHLHDGDEHEADRVIHQAAALFPKPPFDNAERTPAEYHVMAWIEAIHAYGETKKIDFDHSPQTDQAAIESDNEARSTEERCLEWESREHAEYPSKALNRGLVGAAVFTFDVSDAGVPENIKLRASVGAPEFGEVWLPLIPNWRAKVNPAADPACRANYMIFVHFVMDNRRRGIHR